MAFDDFMAGGGWVLGGVMSALFTSGVWLINQYRQHPGEHIVFWSRCVTVAVLLPFAPFMVWPTDPLFYIAVLMSALCAGQGDVYAFNASAKFGGGIVTRTLPHIVWMSFFLWLCFEPDLIIAYIHHPINTALILASLAGCVFFARQANRCAVNHDALKAMMPALGLYTLTVVLNKFSMIHGVELSGTVYAYVVLQCSFIALLLLLRARFKKEAAEFFRIEALQKLLVSACIVTAFWTVSMAFKNTAFYYVENPSYVSAILLLSAVFTSLFYWVTGHKEKANVKSGMGVVFCAIILAVCAI